MTTSPDSLKAGLRSLTFWKENLLIFFILIHRDFHEGWMVGIDILTACIHLQYQIRFLLVPSALLFYLMEAATFSPLTTVGSKLEN